MTPQPRPNRAKPTLAAVPPTAQVDCPKRAFEFPILRLSGIAPNAADIGTVGDCQGPVMLTLGLDGQRLIDVLDDDPLPRIG